MKDKKTDSLTPPTGRLPLKKTKIVATIGPASRSPEVIEELIREGMDVARLNFSHGSRRNHGKKIERIRRASERIGRQVAILTDLAGPKIRIGQIESGKVELKAGRDFTLTTEDIAGGEEIVSVNYDRLAGLVRKGDRILLNDGAVELKVREINKEAIKCKVIIGGEIGSGKGVNLPTRSAGISLLTEKDRRDLDFIINQDIDFIGLSFVREREEIEEVRSLIRQKGADFSLIAKIEKPEAVENIDGIIEAADGIMVARGDLGVELPYERLPVIQKEIIDKANRAGKPVITATQMLESMIESPRPTRAEVSDVAGAIFDGSDAIMLSEETAAGKYPVESVRAMVRIARRVENDPLFQKMNREWVASLVDGQEELPVEESVARSAYYLSRGIGAGLIMSHTSSGSAVRRVAKYRPTQFILGVSENLTTCRRLSLVRGAVPLLISPADNMEEMIRDAIERALKTDFLSRGERVVITAGVPLNHPGHTNVIRVLTAGFPQKTF